MFWPDPTHQPTQPPNHPPNHTPTHGWGICHKFEIFKRNWNILSSSSVIKFLLISGVHPLGGWQMGGWGWRWVWVCGGMFHAHIHAQTCTRMHTCTYMHVKHANHAKHGCLHVGGHLQFLYMYTCVYVNVRACTCVCMCGGTPPMPPDAPDTPPPTCPLPRAAGSPKHQNSISPELIEIIQFCLKILYLWTFLNSYRL